MFSPHVPPYPYERTQHTYECDVKGGHCQASITDDSCNDIGGKWMKLACFNSPHVLQTCTATGGGERLCLHPKKPIATPVAEPALACHAIAFVSKGKLPHRHSVSSAFFLWRAALAIPCLPERASAALLPLSCSLLFSFSTWSGHLHVHRGAVRGDHAGRIRTRSARPPAGLAQDRGLEGTPGRLQTEVASVQAASTWLAYTASVPGTGSRRVHS